MSSADTISLPKAELHLHIEGTLEPEMVFDLAERNSIALPYSDVADLRARYRFDDLQSFLDLYYACMEVLRTRVDFADLTEAYLRKAAAQGVRHVEMFFDPQAHTSRGVPVDDVIDGLLDGFRRAQHDHDLTGGLILCFLRDSPVEDALATLHSVEHRRADLIGVGLDSAEAGYPPELFTEVYAQARSLGLRRVAHAGEEGPAEYITQALDLLYVERIDHGVRCLEDTELVERLRVSRIPLTVCPLSNLRLGGVRTLADHPIRRMIDQGLLVTINSDDPAYFGGYIADNYDAVAAESGVRNDQIVQLARNSILASFASAERKADLLGEFERWVSAESLNG